MKASACIKQLENKLEFWGKQQEKEFYLFQTSYFLTFLFGNYVIELIFLFVGKSRGIFVSTIKVAILNRMSERGRAKKEKTSVLRQLSLITQDLIYFQEMKYISIR